MKMAQENGIHPVITIGQMGDGQYFANLAADKQKRSGFVSFLLEVLKHLPADGIYIQWMYPGCPNVIEIYALLTMITQYELLRI
jgi:GH18 family chitinase